MFESKDGTAASYEDYQKRIKENHAKIMKNDSTPLRRLETQEHQVSAGVDDLAATDRMMLLFCDTKIEKTRPVWIPR